MKKVALIGYSGHALVVAETFMQAGFEIVGYFEKKPVKHNTLNLIYLGSEQDEDFYKKVKYISVFPAIGDNKIRSKLLTQMLSDKLMIAKAISPKANISSYADLGEGTLVCQGSCLNPFVNVGRNVIINTGAIIEHECRISDCVHIAPGAVLSGNVSVGNLSFIGANAVVRQNVIIGNNVIVGAGSVVIENIPDNEIWAGNPAKKIRQK